MSHLINIRLTKTESFLRNWSFSFFKSFSKFNSNFTSRFFDYEKWINIFKKIKRTGSINNPQIGSLPVFFSTGRIVYICMAAKVFFYPIYKNFIGRRNIYSKIIFSSFIVWGFVAPQYDTAFSIKNSSKINKLFSFVYNKSPASKLNYNSLLDMEQVNLTVNVASEETREIVKRCSGLYGNIQRLTEMINPLKYVK